MAASDADAVPSHVMHEAKRSFLNWLGVAIGAMHHETVEIALATVASFAGSPTATVTGRSERLDPLHAAFVNGLSSHVFDFDDTHLRTIIHPSGPVAPVVLALAEQRPTSGREMLHALVLGVEVECRIGNAVYPSHYDVGWHISGTAGVFGAAAAAGKLLGLNPSQLTQALGVASSQAGGMREMFGTMTKPFHVGNAAKNGLFAASLASRGFTSSMRSIEAPRGFAFTAATERDLNELTVNLGQTWEIAVNTYKPFACGIVIHPVIDACIQLREGQDVAAADIESVEVRANPLVLELTGKRTPSVGLEAKFSVFHSAAVAFLDGRASERQYSDERVTDPEVVGLRNRVAVTTSPEIRTDEAFVTVRLASGESRSVHVVHAIGSLEHPMSDDDLSAKFIDVAGEVLPASQLQKILELCWTLEALPDVQTLAAATVPSEA